MSANSTLLQTPENLEEVSTVFENIADFVVMSNANVTDTVCACVANNSFDEYFANSHQNLVNVCICQELLSLCVCSGGGELGRNPQLSHSVGAG